LTTRRSRSHPGLARVQRFADLQDTIFRGQSEGLIDTSGAAARITSRLRLTQTTSKKSSTSACVHSPSRTRGYQASHRASVWVPALLPPGDGSTTYRAKQASTARGRRLDALPIWQSARDDVDVGQPEPGSAVVTDDSKAMGGQHAAEIGRHAGVGTAQPWKGRIAASLAGKDVGKNEHPAWREHAADLGDPGRRFVQCRRDSRRRG
jgi:hypothetical protein